MAGSDVDWQAVRWIVAALIVGWGDVSLAQRLEGPDKRLKEIERRASLLYKEQAQIERERRPVALRRDTLLGELTQARDRMAQLQATIPVTERQIAVLQSQINRLPGSLSKNLQAKQKALEANRKSAIRKISSDRSRIEDRLPQIQSLNFQIQAIDQRLAGVRNELSECRKQWLDIRQPFEKYAVADFEGLRRVLDDWLVLDGQWPEAYAWAALCAHELDETQQATAYLKQAQRMWSERFGPKPSWPQLDALTSLIRGQQPGSAGLANATSSRAVRLANKNDDWQTFFLLGRSYIDRPHDANRAKSYLLQALKIDPNCDCAKLWLARLQTTTTEEKVRDLPSGITSLEQLWSKCERRSWRLACFLAEAYSAAERTDEAQAMWAAAVELVPPEQQRQLAKFHPPTLD